MLLRSVATSLLLCGVFLVCGALTQPAKTAAPQVVNLTVPMRVGDEQVWVYTVDQTQSMFEKDEKKPNAIKKSTNEFRMRLRVVLVEEKSTIVSLTYEAVKMTFDTPYGAQEFDSSKPKEEQEGSLAAPMCKPLVGLKLTITLDAKGQITDVRGGEKLLKGAGERFFGRFVHRQAVSLFLQPVFTLRAAEPESKVGDSWTATSSLDSMTLTSATGTITETRTLTAVERDHSVIDGVSTVDAKFDKATVPKDFKVEFAGRDQYRWSLPENSQGLQGLLGLESKETMTLSFTMPMGAMKSVNEKTERLERKPLTAQLAD